MKQQENKKDSQKEFCRQQNLAKRLQISFPMVNIIESLQRRIQKLEEQIETLTVNKT